MISKSKGLINVRAGIELLRKKHFAGGILIRKGLAQAKKEKLGLEVDQAILDSFKRIVRCNNR